jgi:hypothetical protein
VGLHPKEGFLSEKQKFGIIFVCLAKAVGITSFLLNSKLVISKLLNSKLVNPKSRNPVLYPNN